MVENTKMAEPEVGAEKQTEDGALKAHVEPIESVEDIAKD